MHYFYLFVSVEVCICTCTCTDPAARAKRGFFFFLSFLFFFFFRRKVPFRRLTGRKMFPLHHNLFVKRPLSGPGVCVLFFFFCCWLFVCLFVCLRCELCLHKKKKKKKKKKSLRSVLLHARIGLHVRILHFYENANSNVHGKGFFDKNVQNEKQNICQYFPSPLACNNVLLCGATVCVCVIFFLWRGSERER